MLAFCEKLANEDNYIPSIWNRWIDDPSGKIFVATFNDIPVAMERVVFLSGREAWLEGLRVAPCYRQQGISKILESHRNQ